MYTEHRFPLAAQWLALGTFAAVSPGSTPGWGTKMPQATQSGPKKEKKKSALNILPQDAKDFDKKSNWGDFLGGSVAKTLHSQCRGPEFDP